MVYVNKMQTNRRHKWFIRYCTWHHQGKFAEEEDELGDVLALFSYDVADADADAADDVDDEQAAVIRFAWMQHHRHQQQQQQPYVAGQHLYATCGTATCVFQAGDECQCDDCCCRCCCWGRKCQMLASIRLCRRGHAALSCAAWLPLEFALQRQHKLHAALCAGLMVMLLLGKSRKILSARQRCSTWVTCPANNTCFVTNIHLCLYHFNDFFGRFLTIVFKYLKCAISFQATLARPGLFVKA